MKKLSISEKLTELEDGAKLLRDLRQAYDVKEGYARPIYIIYRDYDYLNIRNPNLNNKGYIFSNWQDKRKADGGEAGLITHAGVPLAEASKRIAVRNFTWDSVSSTCGVDYHNMFWKRQLNYSLNAGNLELYLKYDGHLLVEFVYAVCTYYINELEDLYLGETAEEELEVIKQNVGDDWEKLKVLMVVSTEARVKEYLKEYVKDDLGQAIEDTLSSGKSQYYSFQKDSRLYEEVHEDLYGNLCRQLDEGTLTGLDSNVEVSFAGLLDEAMSVEWDKVVSEKVKPTAKRRRPSREEIEHVEEVVEDIMYECMNEEIPVELMEEYLRSTGGVTGKDEMEYAKKVVKEVKEEIIVEAQGSCHADFTIGSRYYLDVVGNILEIAIDRIKSGELYGDRGFVRGSLHGISSRMEANIKAVLDQNWAEDLNNLLTRDALKIFNREAGETITIIEGNCNDMTI